MKLFFFTTLFVLSAPAFLEAQETGWPDIPDKNASVEIPAQEWPQKPGPRTVKINLHFPGGKRENVTAETGIMLTLHNWGGTDCAGTANPQALADRLNVVAICVNYLQSGRKASVDDPEPYDFGYLQGLDALRALWFVFDGLKKNEIPFAEGRLFATGGSGGGNVTLMVNKLAPRTFACIIDMCGMPELSDDIAFNEPGGTGLNARWSRDPDSPYYLSPGAQELRHVGRLNHLQIMKRLGNTTRIAVVHGQKDNTCPYDDARRMVKNMEAAKLDVRPFFIGEEDLDGKVFKSAGHALGNRTEIVFKVAGDWLESGSPEAIIRKGPTDFERSDGKVRYPVTGGGIYVISYENGYPVGEFDPGPLPRPLAVIAARMEPDRKVIYKTAGARKLELHLFEPSGYDPTKDRRPVFMIIHGGGWQGGEPRKFYPVADHFAKLGMLGISLQYRLHRPNGKTTVFDCVKDGRSAVRFLRTHAEELGIDPEKIVVSGGSAGGHVAVGAALFDGIDEEGEDTSISCRPDALVLLNPVIDTSADGYGQAKIGERWQELSPLHQVRGGMPPTIIFHSTGDTVAPFAGAKLFTEKSKAAGNDCELAAFEGGRHGYFIFDLKIYDQVLKEIEAFLRPRGFLLE